MKLIINTRFELDVELVDEKPKYLKTSSNIVIEQTINVSEDEMMYLLSYLNFSSDQFNDVEPLELDENTLYWSM